MGINKLNKAKNMQIASFVNFYVYSQPAGHTLVLNRSELLHNSEKRPRVRRNLLLFACANLEGLLLCHKIGV